MFPTPAALFGSILFGSIGMGAFIYGKRSTLMKPMLLGIILMVYPYFVNDSTLLYLLGAALTGALFIWRD